MRHIVSIVLQNEAGALARVANLFSSRGYNIESLNVAPMIDVSMSRLTLVTSGSPEVIDQIAKQLGKLVDIVSLTDLTRADHIERELALVKVQLEAAADGRLKSLLSGLGARVLDDNADHYTVELVGGHADIDRFLASVTGLGKILSVVRSGAMAVSRGIPASPLKQ